MFCIKGKAYSTTSSCHSWSGLYIPVAFPQLSTSGQPTLCVQLQSLHYYVVPMYKLYQQTLIVLCSMDIQTENHSMIDRFNFIQCPTYRNVCQSYMCVLLVLCLTELCISTSLSWCPFKDPFQLDSTHVSKIVKQLVAVNAAQGVGQFMEVFGTLYTNGKTSCKWQYNNLVIQFENTFCN